MKKKSTLFLGTLITISLSASLNAITFEFQTASGSDLAGTAFSGVAGEASYMDGSGLTIFGEAFEDGNSTGTIFNRTSSSFGINGALGSADDTDQIDGDGGVESAVFSFSQNVVLTSIDFESFGGTGNPGDDLIAITISGGGFSLNVDGNDFTNDLVTVSQTITTSQTLTISFVDGNGVGLESISVDLAVVPEPSTYAAILGAIALCGVIVRRRLKK